MAFVQSQTLSRRFGLAAALLAAVAVLLTSLTSLLLISLQHEDDLRHLRRSELSFNARLVSNDLEAISYRLATIADSSILANALIDSAGRETYLLPFLQGFEQVNGVPVQLVFADFEGNEIARNGIAKFSADNKAWIQAQLERGIETATVQEGEQGAEILGIELLRYSRTSTPEGALFYKFRLGDLQPATTMRIAWDAHSMDRTAEEEAADNTIDIEAPFSFVGLGLRLEQTVQDSETVEYHPTWQYLTMLGMAIGLALLVFLIASRLAHNLTHGLRELEAFSSGMGKEGTDIRRAPISDTAEVASLAHSINRMLDRLYEQQDRLQTERKRFHQLANTIPQLAWIADPDGSVTWYNDRWYAYTGTTFDQMRGEGWQKVFHPDHLERAILFWENALAAGETVRMTFPIRSAGGQYRHFYTSVAPLRDAEGRIVQWFGTNTDVTLIEEAELALRQSEARLQQGLVAARMAVWESDAASGRLQFSANLASVFGAEWTTVDELWPMIDPRDRPALQDAIRENLAGGSGFHASVRLHRADQDRTVWLDMRIQAGFDRQGHPAFLSAVALDVSERKHAEEALRAADRQKDEFLAMLAHELRNPLAPIGMAAQLLGMVDLPDPRVRQTSEIIQRQVEHMTRLIDELLDMSRITRGLVTLKRESVELGQVLAEAVGQTRPLIDAKRHRFSLASPGEPVWLYGDRTRLVQVVANLLNNAAKYTMDGGDVRLWAQASAGAVRIGVRDNGSGISTELLPQVFELFTQDKRTLDRSQGGLGLGLAVVRKLVALHGGTVSAHSAGVGQGSEFVIELPLAAAEREAVPAASVPFDAPETFPLQFLIVDDNVDAADTLALLLTEKGHSASVRYTAESALDALALTSFDAVFLDIGLPHMDGFAVARRIRGQFGDQAPILVAVTGYGGEHDREQSRAAGFVRHLVKPVGAEELAVLLKELTQFHTAARHHHALKQRA